MCKYKVDHSYVINLFFPPCGSARLSDLVDSQLRSKKSRRCVLHSLDSQRTRVLTTAWRDVWAVMRPQCRDEVVLIEASTLMATLENYLRKHR